MAFHFPKGVPSYPVGVRVEAPADPARAAGAIQHPLGQLPREDQDLIVQLVLHSGSLKDLATEYGVSYPTVRGRLDRLIAKVRAAEEPETGDAFERAVRILVADGKLAPGIARELLEVHRVSKEVRR